MLHLNHKTSRSLLAWDDLMRLYRATTAEDAAIAYGMMIGSAYDLTSPWFARVLSLYQSKREELTACPKVGF